MEMKEIDTGGETVNELLEAKPAGEGSFSFFKKKKRLQDLDARNSILSEMLIINLDVVFDLRLVLVWF